MSNPPAIRLHVDKHFSNVHAKEGLETTSNYGHHSYSGPMTASASQSGGYVPIVLNSSAGTITFSGVPTIAAGGSTGPLTLNLLTLTNNLVNTQTLGMFVLQSGPAIAQNRIVQITAVGYSAGSVTLELTNYGSAATAGNDTYKFSFVLFNPLTNQLLTA